MPDGLTFEIHRRSFNAKHLGQVGKVCIVVQERAGLNGALLDPAVALVDFSVRRGKKPGRPGFECPSRGWAGCP